MAPDHPRLYKTTGIILKSTPIGEADRVVTLYTHNLGKLRATARGVRRVKSRLGGHLDTLNLVSLSLARGRSHDVITGAEAVETSPALKGNLERLAYGLYIVELVDAITPEEVPSHPIYTITQTTLHRLSGTEKPRILLHAFELQLLDHSGFLPELHRCIQCRRKPNLGAHRYAPHAGGLLCDMCFSSYGPVMPLSGNALKVLRFLERHNVNMSEQLNIPEELDRELTTLLFASIHHVLERDIRTSSFITHLRQPSMITLPTPTPELPES